MVKNRRKVRYAKHLFIAGENIMRTDKEYSQAVKQAKENLTNLNERGADTVGCSFGNGERKSLKKMKLRFKRANCRKICVCD